MEILKMLFLKLFLMVCIKIFRNIRFQIFLAAKFSEGIHIEQKCPIAELKLAMVL
jgi:hypothetical protein